MDWNAVIAIATVVSMVAYIVTALYIRAELKALEKDRYLAVTSQLFALWQSHDFMRDQLWLLHRQAAPSWAEFLRVNRGDAGEVVFHRVGSFYDRIGTLVRLGLVDREEMLTTIAPYAISIWRKIEPLVREARRAENSQLFLDFERLLPACHECYVPALGPAAQVAPSAPTEVRRISAAALAARLRDPAPITLLDVRQAAQVAAEPNGLAHAVWMPPDQVSQRLADVPLAHEVVVYCA